MIIEQIRYFVEGDDLGAVLAARREVSRVREQLGLPTGKVLVADPPPDNGPSIVWQCGYADEGEMGAVESALIGNGDYESARGHLSTLVVRAELELYTPEEET